MNEPNHGDREHSSQAGEATAVLPETAAQLVEMERLQQALAEAEERARSHWEQYLRARRPESRAQAQAAVPLRPGLRDVGQQALCAQQLRQGQQAEAAAGVGQELSAGVVHGALCRGRVYRFQFCRRDGALCKRAFGRQN